MADNSFPPASGPARSSGGAVNGWLVAILLICVAALYLQMTGMWPRALFDPNAAPRAITPRGDLADDEKATIELFQAVSKSVVHITTSTVERRFRMNPLEVQRGSGSGFVWDENGYIVTNYHVIRGASRVKVFLSDSSSYEARVVGRNRANDLAVVKIDAPPGKLKPIPVGTSGDLKVGQKVFAIGSPFSLDQSLTTGVVSGLGREIESEGGGSIKDVIQVNAAINPGNSGGPLLDSAGRLIGVNTAIVSPTGAFSGIGFAIPVDAVNSVAPLLIKSVSTEPPALGVSMFRDDQTAMLRERGVFKEEGVLVADVTPGSAAHAAGVTPTRQTFDGGIVLGDLIIAVDRQPVHDVKTLIAKIAEKRVGDVVTLTVVRRGKQVELPVTLQPRPDAGDE